MLDKRNLRPLIVEDTDVWDADPVQVALDHSIAIRCALANKTGIPHSKIVLIEKSAHLERTVFSVGLVCGGTRYGVVGQYEDGKLEIEHAGPVDV